MAFNVEGLGGVPLARVYSADTSGAEISPPTACNRVILVNTGGAIVRLYFEEQFYQADSALAGTEGWFPLASDAPLELPASLLGAERFFQEDKIGLWMRAEAGTCQVHGLWFARRA